MFSARALTRTRGHLHHPFRPKHFHQNPPEKTAWDPVKQLREIPTIKEKIRFLSQRGKVFVSVAWKGTKTFLATQKLSRCLRPKVADMSCTRKEYRIVYHNSQDWKKIIPLLFWWKILPFSALYIPLYLLVNPNLLPNSFDVATLAEMDSAVTLFDNSVRDVRKKYLDALPETIDKNFPALRLLQKSFEEKDYISAQAILENKDLLMNEPNLDLKNLTTAQLKAISCALGSQALTVRFWPKMFLITKLRGHTNHIHTDDNLLKREGIDQLTLEELREACLERGLSLRRTPEELKNQLLEWLTFFNFPEIKLRLLACAHGFQFQELKIGPNSTQ